MRSASEVWAYLGEAAADAVVVERSRARFGATQTIARSAEDVWAYAADIVRHAEWMTVTDARIVRGDGHRSGRSGGSRMRFGPFGWDVEFEVTEATPGRRIV